LSASTKMVARLSLVIHFFNMQKHTSQRSN
jgi:hypothetical protein